MMMNTKVLDWVKNFKYSWLPDHVNHDAHLIKIISNKLDELEQLLETDSQYQSDSPLVLTSLDNQPTNDGEDELFSHPAIRIKRLSLAEAERFLPPGWDTPKPKPRRKKGRKKLTLSSSSRKRNRNAPAKVHQETKVDSNGTRKSTRSSKLLLSPLSSDSPSRTEAKSKQKRKLRAMDNEDDDLNTLGNLTQTENALDDCEQISRYIGQNGILSQTRKTNETTMNTTTTSTASFEETHDLTLKLFPTTATTNEDAPITDDPIESSSNENHHSELNYDACIEDITNDGIDPPPPASSSSPNQFEQLPLTT